ncbi:MAG: ORF6N domain-containing protein [Pseudomonadota bacterium]
MADETSLPHSDSVKFNSRANIVDGRGKSVLLDRDVAKLFDVQVRVLNQKVTRNKKRFKDAFAFRLEWEEFEELRSRNVILQGWPKVTYPPVAFTEYGIVMVATVLNSDRAIEATQSVVETFVDVRRKSWEREIEKTAVKFLWR